MAVSVSLLWFPSSTGIRGGSNNLLSHSQAFKDSQASTYVSRVIMKLIFGSVLTMDVYSYPHV